MGIACAQFVVAVLFACGMQLVAARVIQLRARELLRAVAPGLVCGAAVAVTGLGVLAAPVLGGVTTLVLVVPTAIAVVYTILRFGFRPVHDELVGLLRRK